VASWAAAVATRAAETVEVEKRMVVAALDLDFWSESKEVVGGG